MKLSICMMIKDEEKNLDRCLNSLVPIMEKIESELIIIDTGSTDESPNIARRFTDKVYFHKWNNNFSEMRNISISYAKGEWILIIDADEELKSYDEIILFLSSYELKRYNAATILCENVTGNSEYNSIVLVTPRLFKNDGKFEYIGSVHNMPVFSQPVKNLKDTLLHYGYLVTDKELIEKKFKRTSTLLKKELEKDSNNIYYRYQLSVSYLAHGDKIEALKECEKSYENIKDNRLNLREYFYVYPHLVKCLCSMNNYYRAKIICEEAIKIEKEQLDMYCYLGEILLNLNEFDDAITAFNKYLDLVKNYNKLSIANDTMMYFEKLGYIEKVYHYIVIIHYKKKNYNEVLKYSGLIKLKEIVKESMSIFIESFIKLSKYSELKDYCKKIILQDKIIEQCFYDNVENLTKNIKYSSLLGLYEAMSNGNDKYSILNKLRVAIIEKKYFSIDIFKNYIIDLNLNDLPEYYSDILYYCMNSNIDFYTYLYNVSESNIIKYLLYLENKYSDFLDLLKEYLNDYTDQSDFKYIRVNKIAFKFIIFAKNYDNATYNNVFLKYVDFGMRYITLIYNKELIENEWIADVKNNEEAFLIYMKKAFGSREENKIEYIKLLKKSLNTFPEMSKGIKLLLEKYEREFIKENEEFELYKINIKSTINELIGNNKLDEACKLINEYEKIVKNDIEIYSIKAVISIMQNRLEEAESILKSGLEIKKNNFDLLYNLAYLYENKGLFNYAIKMYRKAYNSTKDYNLKIDIKKTIQKLFEYDKIQGNIDEFLESKRVLLMCHFYSVYTKEFMENMWKNGFDGFDVLTMDSVYNNNVCKDAINEIFQYENFQQINYILSEIKKYDIIHVHFLTPFYGEFAKQIKQKCNKLIITIWGSDFYRTSKDEKEKQRKIIEVADVITFDNEVTLKEFVSYYGKKYLKRCCVNRFGLTALEYINKIEDEDKNSIKEQYDIPINSIVVTCGYNANPAHNHLEIIKSIKLKKEKLPENMYYIFPMTYSRDEEYCRKVKNELLESGLNFMILENFMNFDEIARFTKVTDIMIQLQITDTLSATMQEHMYNGNVIVTGKWLPYKPLKKIGSYFLDISSVNNIGSKLMDVVQNLKDLKQKSKRNKDIIWNFSAWENTVESWIEVYNKEISTNLSEFNHAAYWDCRYGNKFDLESSGTMGLGLAYNKYLYKSRLDILEHLKVHLFEGFMNKKVLELGTGTGYFTKYFSEQNIESYYGIDISKKSIDNLSSLYKDFKFKCGNISDITAYESDKTYDLIFSSDVLLHLTDNEKFQESIHNIAEALDDNGYFIDIEPITVVGVETSSPHNRIIKYEEYNTALEKENLEIVDIIPVTFFMDYPFDYEIMGSIGKKALNNFNEITAYLHDNSYTLEEKEKMAEKIYYFDKCFLKYYGKGLSNKLTIIKKKVNPNVYRAVIENIWASNEFVSLNGFEKFNIGTLISTLNEEEIYSKKGEEPLITVAIINYNYSRYIDECINSILNQNYNNIDILIIDDCSKKDNSIEKIREYTQNYKNIRAIYHEVNKGLTTGLRDAIQYANGKYLIPISADDYFYTRSALKELACIMEKDATVNYVHCNLVNVDKDCNYRGTWTYKQYTTDEMVFNTFNNMGVAIVPSTAGLYRVEFFKRNKITWYEDKELGIDGDDGINSLYFAKHDWNYKYIDSGLIAYRQHNNNMSFNFEIRIKYLISAIEFIASNFNEKVYLPQIPWEKLTEQQRMAIKMFKIGEKYWEMFIAHYNDSIKPWQEIQFSFSENYLVFKNIQKYIKLYFDKSIKVDDLLKDNIESILSKIERCFTNINNN